LCVVQYAGFGPASDMIWHQRVPGSLSCSVTCGPALSKWALPGSGRARRVRSQGVCGVLPFKVDLPETRRACNASCSQFRHRYRIRKRLQGVLCFDADIRILQNRGALRTRPARREACSAVPDSVSTRRRGPDRARPSETGAGGSAGGDIRGTARSGGAAAWMVSCAMLSLPTRIIVGGVESVTQTFRCMPPEGAASSSAGLEGGQGGANVIMWSVGLCACWR